MVQEATGYSTPLPGTMKRKIRGVVHFFPVIRQTIMDNDMRTTLTNVGLSTRGKARWAALKHIKNQKDYGNRN